jgi:hypothetical protein
MDGIIIIGPSIKIWLDKEYWMRSLKSFFALAAEIKHSKTHFI